MITIATEIAPHDLAEALRDAVIAPAERITLIRALLESIQEDGEIAQIRALVSEPGWDDLAPEAKKARRG